MFNKKPMAIAVNNYYKTRIKPSIKPITYIKQQQQSNGEA